MQSKPRLVRHTHYFIFIFTDIHFSSEKRTEMEFAEMIKISRVDNVRLRRPAEDSCEVTVAVTGHHLILSIQVVCGEAHDSNIEQ